MELSEGIYQDLHHHPNDGQYDDVGTQKPRKAKGHHVWKKLTLALVGLLCVLLLVITGLFAMTMAVRNQCESDFSSLQTEKAMEVAELESNLTQERHQRNQLKLQHSQLQTSYNITAEEKDNLQARLCKLENDVKQYAVDVTLDPETAYPYLILSADGKQVKCCRTGWDPPDNPKRFDKSISVLGKQGFSSGRFYYEVQVKDKKGWFLGVTRESSKRKGSIKHSQENGYWIISQSNWTDFWATDDDSYIPLKPLNTLERVGVFVDYEDGLVSFYNADHWELLYSYKHAHFNGTIFPVFNPHDDNRGQNVSPLVIHTPVACQYHEYK